MNTYNYAQSREDEQNREELANSLDSRINYIVERKEVVQQTSK